MEAVANRLLDLDDEYESRRLLALYELLDPQLLEDLVGRGEQNADPDIRETAEEYRHTPSPSSPASLD